MEQAKKEEEAYMRQGIRALGWAITITTVLLFIFLVTAISSVFEMVLAGQGFGFGEFQTSFSGNRLVLSMPITVNNTGYFDINNYRITTTLKDHKGVTLATNSTIIEEIKRGSQASRLHSFSLDLVRLIPTMMHLLFNDTEFRIDFSVGLKYAYALDLQLTLTNMSIPWGAPLYGLNVGGIGHPRFNGTHLVMDIALELENHSFLDIAGRLNLKIYNELRNQIGSGTVMVHVPPGARLTRPIPIVIEVSNPFAFTGRGYAEVSFELPMIEQAFDIGRVDYG